MTVEHSRRFKSEACQKCGLVTRDIKQAEISGKWYYACPECRGVKFDERESRRAKLRKMHAKDAANFDY